jgi:hypothetical protein
MKIFSDKLFRLKSKLYLVVAGDAGSRQKLTVVGFYRQLVFVAEGYIQIDWFLERIGDGFSVNIPRTKKLLVSRSGWLNRYCQ